jgi:hypothetical protein
MVGCIAFLAILHGTMAYLGYHANVISYVVDAIIVLNCIIVGGIFWCVERRVFGNIMRSESDKTIKAG